MDVLATKEYRDSSEYPGTIDAMKCSTVIFLARWFKDELKSLGCIAVAFSKLTMPRSIILIIFAHQCEWSFEDSHAVDPEDLAENAQKIAEFLSAHPKVKKVNYAGLPSHPGRSLITLFPGSVKSLISMPCFMSHASIPAAVREARGLTEDLVRISVGIEDVNDLISDLDNALRTGPV
ncbi:hypothetical protein RHSIM_Rhsim03G0042100 [Rhododendron simsii]|uniref:Cystathionine gamma-synthase n=1 Tax=Rhododendron simsii TaxID=118357 RepID=A0A834H7N1_RHOSS|nr:hypothetical protein RHSIM_Rhsim03G0042100 [Rhododendron simsii]